MYLILSGCLSINSLFSIQTIFLTMIKNLLIYLKALSQLKTRKVIRDIFIDHYKTIHFEKIMSLDGVEIPEFDTDNITNFFLQMPRPTAPILPSPPQNCLPYIKNKDELNNPNSSPQLINFSELSETEKIDIARQNEINNEWEKYINEQWSQWQKKQKCYLDSLNFYEQLFKLYQHIQKEGESYQFCLGLGILYWYANDESIRYPLIIADVDLVFDSENATFYVQPSENGCNLRIETDFLDGISGELANFNRACNLLKEAINNIEHPWQKSSLSDALSAFVHMISSNGNFQDLSPKNNLSISPVVAFSPVLLHRPRSQKSFVHTIDTLLQTLPANEDTSSVPSLFLPLLGKSLSNNNDNHIFDNDDMLYFPKPANEEQKQIIQKLRYQKAVIVQGPPGTGKSHTIANLICHLLASGKRILITAEKPQALNVLLDKLPEEMRPLCVNTLDKQSLERSINQILQRSELHNTEEAKKEEIFLKEKLTDVQSRYNKTYNKLYSLREQELLQNNIAEYHGTLQKITENLREEAPQFEWFTDSVKEDTLPFDSKELLYYLNELRYFTVDRRKELRQFLPKIDKFISPENFKKAIQIHQKFSQEINDFEQKIVNSQRQKYYQNIDQKQLETIQHQLEEWKQNFTQLSEHPVWLSKLLKDSDTPRIQLWKNCLQESMQALSKTKPLLNLIEEIPLKYPSYISLSVIAKDAQNLVQYLYKGGRTSSFFGLLKPKIIKEREYLITEITIGGQAPNRLEQFEQIEQIANALLIFERAYRAWPENTIVFNNNNISTQWSILQTQTTILQTWFNSLFKRSKEIHKLFQDNNIPEPNLLDIASINDDICICQCANKQQKQKAIENIFEQHLGYIKRIKKESNSHPIINLLQKALIEKDYPTYFSCFNKISQLIEDRSRLFLLNKKIKDFNRILPNLIKDLIETPENLIWDKRINMLDKAWRYTYVRQMINKMINEYKYEDLNQLENELYECIPDIEKATAMLGAHKAWQACLPRIKDEERQAMNRWQNYMKKIGKGTGKQVPQHRRNAQKALEQCRHTIPAWVIPLARLWDTITPSPEMFDIVIIDEASQCDFSALPLLYLSKKIIIIGDDQQTSPEAIGINSDAVHDLQQKYLTDHPNPDDFSPDMSLFDYGKIYFASPLTLKEHFRCEREIITFCSQNFYDNQLIPLKPIRKNRLLPIQHHFIDGAVRQGDKNKQEAQAIIKAIITCCKNSDYDGKTMGIISLLSSAMTHIKYIENELLAQLGTEEIERRQLRVGNAADFQGDERDVIFLSLVSAPNQIGRAMTTESDKRRFNVAVSRAREQLHLFYSITPAALTNPEDWRRKLLDYCMADQEQHISGISRYELEEIYQHTDRKNTKPPEPFDSWFEVSVALDLLRLGYAVIPQFKVNQYRIDLVVEFEGKRLAIECDGDYWHSNDGYSPDAFEKDFIRQQQLQRSGWKFFRILGSSYYHNPQFIITKLCKCLEENGIFPAFSKERDCLSHSSP